jgi:hypothetical protein
MLRDALAGALLFLGVLVGIVELNPTTHPNDVPRCLKWTPNPANQPKNCVDVPGQERPAVDVDHMRADFKRTRWNRNHY